MLIVGIDIGSYFTSYAYSYEFENKTFLKSAKYLTGFNLEKVVQDNTVYIIKKLLTLEKNTDPVPKNFMFLSEMLTEKDFLAEIKKYIARIAKIIPVDQDADDQKFFVVSYPRGLLPKPPSKVYLDAICDVITKGIRSNEQYKDAKVYFITDYEALRQCYKELIIKKKKIEFVANSYDEEIQYDINTLAKKYSKSLILMNDKNTSAIAEVENKDYEKAYEELLGINSIFNALNDIDVETYKTLYIDFGLKEIRFHYSEFINIIKPIKNSIIDDLTDILIEQHLATFCYNLSTEKQRALRLQLRDDVKSIILPKFVEADDFTTYHHEFKFEMIHVLKITKEMIDDYIQNSLLCDVIERIYDSANSPIHHIELCGGFSNLYYKFLSRYFPNLSIKISNINVSVGCVYFEQQLLEKEKLLRNKYREAKLDCKNQLEKLKASLEEENLSYSFITKEQSDFFHRQQEKQQQLIENEKNKNGNSDMDWVGKIHRRDVKEQEQLFTGLFEKLSVVENRINIVKEKIKKIQDFSDGLDKYYRKALTTFGSVNFDFFNSYSIIINSNSEEEEEEEGEGEDGDKKSDKTQELLQDLKISPNDVKSYYFKKLGMSIDENGSGVTEGKKETKIKVVSSFTDLNNATTASQSDNESIEKVAKPAAVTNVANKEYAPSLCSNLSGISGIGHTPGKNALSTLNNKFISFNLQTQRLKMKTQLLEENHTLGIELKKSQTKNFTLSEELNTIRQENKELKEENERLLKELEALRAKLSLE
ncbi:hypothetical protein BCR36DRAFT_348506 [Piromyces finnis]|uniref:Actin-like ATPase domain-containing protein n=1 Tax=Piromyces finnis TaxID=1754191 RepID=A0A1Y1VFW0_9FUNG|nr:hypothetical protein BCR36DRAFT_348506 [Piromyces finnis]|eukprot:ORX54332.1 hypothetical protein BCR36DRAFT_348506 [Piromyces finnis]